MNRFHLRVENRSWFVVNVDCWKNCDTKSNCNLLYFKPPMEVHCIFFSAGGNEGPLIYNNSRRFFFRLCDLMIQNTCTDRYSMPLRVVMPMKETQIKQYRNTQMGTNRNSTSICQNNIQHTTRMWIFCCLM